MFHEYDVVKGKKDLSSVGLSAEALGTVMMVLSVDPPQYLVEFVDNEGRTLALLTLGEAEIERVGSPHDTSTPTPSARARS
jgi:hypothetical protein